MRLAWEEWWFVEFPDAIIFAKTNEEVEKHPFFNMELHNGKYFWISASLLNIEKLKKNIKPSSYSALWYRKVDKLLKYWRRVEGKQVVEYLYNIDKENEMSLRKVNILIAWMKKLTVEIDIDEQLLDVRDNVNYNIESKNVLSYLFSGKEIEDAYWFPSHNKNIALDIVNIKENVSWSSFDLIRYYNKGNVDKVKEILSTLWYEVEKLDSMFSVNVGESNLVQFTKEWVFYIEEQKQTVIKTELFDVPIYLKWRCRSQYNLLSGDKYDIEQTSFIVVNMITEEEIPLSYYETKNRFNWAYWAMWLRFLWTDRSLQYLYSALDERAKIKKVYKVIPRNWLYPEHEVLIHWWSIYKGEESDDFIILAKKYDVTNHKKQITIHEACKFLQEYYDPARIVIPYIWFLWWFLKRWLDDFNIRTPLLMNIGKTWSGKTEGIYTIMRLLGYKIGWVTQSRQRVIPLEWTTQQPLMYALQDYTPIFLDEMTANLKMGVEEIIRWVFNNQSPEKGAVGKNIIFDLRSPVAIAGERLPQYTSVINRWVLIEYKDEFKVKYEDYKMIKQELTDVSVWDDFREKIINITDEDIQAARDQWFPVEFANNDRVNENYQFIIIVNRLLWLVDEELLSNRSRELATHQDKILSGRDEVERLRHVLLFENKKQQTYLVTVDQTLTLSLVTTIVKDIEKFDMYIHNLKKDLWDQEQETTLINIDLDRLFYASKNDKHLQKKFNQLVRFYKWCKDVPLRDWFNARVGLAWDFL